MAASVGSHVFFHALQRVAAKNMLANGREHATTCRKTHTRRHGRFFVTLHCLLRAGAGGSSISSSKSPGVTSSTRQTFSIVSSVAL
jgi:hypothetical protein